MLADNMPDQLIVKAFGDIPEELVDVEKLLQEAGLSGAGLERPKRKRCSEYDLRKRVNDTRPDIPIDVETLIEEAGYTENDLSKEDMEDRFVNVQW